MKLYALTLAALLATVSFAQATDASTPPADAKLDVQLDGAPVSEEDVNVNIQAPAEAK